MEGITTMVHHLFLLRAELTALFSVEGLLFMMILAAGITALAWMSRLV